MASFVPTSLAVLLGVAVAGSFLIVIGFLVQRTKSRAIAWGLVVATIAGTHIVLQSEPPGFRMVALIVLATYALKALVVVESRRADAVPLDALPWLAFTSAWIGMQPREFRHSEGSLSATRLFATSATWLLAGVITVLCVQWIAQLVGPGWRRTCAFLLLIGCSMVVHFGFTGLVAAALRRCGFNVGPQFRAPWRARSLQEFWARRWNIGYSVMTAIVVYRPAERWLGRTGALVLAFLTSGLLHELGCSLPVRAGYGLPSLYFALHAGAVVIENALDRRRIKWRNRWGRLWVFVWVVLPAPLVFHDPFMSGIVEPWLP